LRVALCYRRVVSLRRLVVVALFATACPGPHTATGPETTLANYLAAVNASRLDEAYALLSTDYKKTHDRAAFARALGDRRTAAGKLRGAQVTLRAEVELPDGDRLPLVLEEGVWRFARDPLDFYPQRAPTEALRSFMRAVDNHRYDVVLRFVPSRYRATLTVERLRDRWEGEKRAEVMAQLAAVRAHLDEPLEVNGDEARLPVGERKQAKLVREDGAWKIETLE
jgi:hypothetical protein